MHRSYSTYCAVERASDRCAQYRARIKASRLESVRRVGSSALSNTGYTTSNTLLYLKPTPIRMSKFLYPGPWYYTVKPSSGERKSSKVYGAFTSCQVKDWIQRSSHTIYLSKSKSGPFLPFSVYPEFVPVSTELSRRRAIARTAELARQKMWKVERQRHRFDLTYMLSTRNRKYPKNGKPLKCTAKAYSGERLRRTSAQLQLSKNSMYALKFGNRRIYPPFKTQ